MQHSRRWFFLIIIFILGALVALAVSCRSDGALMPRRGTPSSSGPLFGHPEPVALPVLDDNPAAYRNQLIRVTGAHTPLPLPECGRVRGPAARWALVDQGLRLDAVGYEGLLGLVPEGIELTVDGFWRLHEGPLGCGKEPPTDRLWYLEAVRLVQPNPLPLLGGRSLALDASPRISVTMSVSTLTPTLATDASPTPSGTPTPSRTPTATETPGPGTPSATPDATSTPATDGTPTLTPTGTPTNAPGAATSTPTGTAAPSPTRTGGNTPTPPPPTNTPGPYPGGSDETSPPTTSTPSGGYP